MTEEDMALHPEYREFRNWAESYIKTNPDEWPLLGGYEREEFYAFQGWLAARQQKPLVSGL